MSPSDRVQEVVIKAASRWHGVRSALSHETRVAAETAAWAEWRRRRRERKAAIRAALREHRARNGGVRRESLIAGARILRQQAAQAQVDKEFELRERLAKRALNPTPQPPQPPHPHPLEEREDNRDRP